MQQEEFERLYRSTAGALRQYALRTCGSPQQAADVVHEAFLRLLAAPPDRAPLREPVHYLYRLTMNLLRDEWRRQRRRAEQALPEGFEVAAREASPLARLELQAALAPLSRSDRQLLWLAYAEGFSHREIAAIMGRAATSIRVLLFRARQRLERELARRRAPGVT